MTYSKMISDHRIAAGYTQFDVASHLGVHFTVISQIENGLRRQRNLTMTLKMARLFGLSEQQTIDLIQAQMESLLNNTMVIEVESPERAYAAAASVAVEF